MSTAVVRAEEKVDYTTQIKPIFTHHCATCHGPVKQKGNVRLDAGILIHKGTDEGPILTPGKAEESLLIKAVTGVAGVEKMPKEGAPLSADQVALLKQWINEGAAYPKEERVLSDPAKHWAFVPPTKAALPTVKNQVWSAHPIDAFLAKEHETRGLTPLGEAEPRALIRRVYLDLIGLPPTEAEVEAFVKECAEAEAEAVGRKPSAGGGTTAAGLRPTAYDSPAYLRLIDRLLASPRYGERWGRHWMDIWRYSDWYGYGNELRNSQKHMWRFRDWIIESLNADKPYDKMIVEMIAADEAAPSDPAALRATGFLARNYYKFSRHVWLDSIVEHTGKAFVGLTMNCARCHDHMYDPISQEEYYRFRAIFEPHQLRYDRVPGEADVEKNGVSRVYDAEPNVKTFLFDRGNDKRPREDLAITPGVPKVFGATAGEMAIAPVKLPVEAYYPGLQPFVRQEALAAAQKDVNAKRAASGKARADVEALKKKLDDVKQQPDAPAPATEAAKDGNNARKKEELKAIVQRVDAGNLEAALNGAESAAAVAKKRLDAAEAHLWAIDARLAADVAKYASPPAPDADDKARAAVSAMRRADLLAAEAALAEAAYQLSRAQAVFESDAKKNTKPVEEAKKKVADAEKKVEQGKAAMGKIDANYTGFSANFPKESTGRRLALAQWIASKKNPLTARVAVNHIWSRHFGQPLVSTVFDFGLNGKPPSHPALLDWLAADFMEHGWSLKHLHRTIVTSMAYRMASAEGTERPRDHGTKASNPTPDTRHPTPTSTDADNIYLWRMNSRRMEAEVVRDSMIYLAGRLDTTMAGPDLDHNTGLTTYRRSIYYRHALEKQMEFLEMFDAASPTECYRRPQTIIPQQALALANSSLALDMSRLIARDLSAQVKADPNDAESDARFIRAAFARVLCRLATEAEAAACLEFLAEQGRSLPGDAKAKPAENERPGQVKPSTVPSLRAKENLIHALLNHHEFVAIR